MADMEKTRKVEFSGLVIEQTHISDDSNVSTTHIAFYT